MMLLLNSFSKEVKLELSPPTPAGATTDPEGNA